jgi:co-chaperonin GroES (HSP10)
VAGFDDVYDADLTRMRVQEISERDASLLDGMQRGKMLPQPQGFRILCALPVVAEKSQGGIIRPEDSRQREEIASNLLLVLALGPDCYADRARFPTGPWCKEGDFILVRSYSGTRFKVRGQELRLINDDMVEAVVEDPRGFSRY